MSAFVEKLKLQSSLIFLAPLWIFVRITPLRLQFSSGRQWGRCLKSFKGKTHHTTSKNLEICFPHLSKKKRNSLLHKTYKSLGMALMETLMSWWLPNKRLQSLLTLHGKEHLDKALETQGVMLISPHFITLELVGRLLTQHLEFAVMYRPQKIKILDRIIFHYRKKHYADIIPRDDIRKMVKILKNKKIVWYAPDSDHGVKNSVFAPFFGIPTATVTGTSRIAKMANAKIIPCFFYRKKDKPGYDLYFHPPCENFPSDDLFEDASRINQLLQTAILKSPEEYLWQYKRFKTRPAGETRFY
ncbi:MAG: hypothetical protein ACD_44C00033G0016 [uncultured bacterium]|nr:MAG: hypothetical protein ACD_44C00033G0016 [uncultured bacterium]OGT16953.1 MAG: hypothetical protein A3B69_00300 [Gammaproteobacteria bacterium RIFCSPHIGHO2_02_FULL_38_33]OGT23274.1 MAG: hypothetical protein A2W47_06545 [Gammaproteobacteria bacterium RIFCSPHIGHO2_12_38_15]OGT77083.1 MAG: hypothetical protein A3G71_04035 [Gammaproteobacteria bacterium RIFCSPLOWO2_12_FULL_38_14]